MINAVFQLGLYNFPSLLKDIHHRLIGCQDIGCKSLDASILGVSDQHFIQIGCNPQTLVLLIHYKGNISAGAALILDETGFGDYVALPGFANQTDDRQYLAEVDIHVLLHFRVL